MPKSDERGSPGPRECICSFPHGDKGFRAFEMLENIEFSLKLQTNGVLVTLPGLVVSKASLPKGSAGFPCCPTSGPLQGPLYRTQLPVRHIAHQAALLAMLGTALAPLLQCVSEARDWKNHVDR